MVAAQEREENSVAITNGRLQHTLICSCEQPVGSEQSPIRPISVAKPCYQCMFLSTWVTDSRQ